MGSSSVSCVLTGVSLANQPAVLLPLAPGEYTNRRGPTNHGGASIISNEGAAALYSPLTLPLFGHVGDAGDFRYLEEDDNTRYLQRKLGDMEKFADLVTGGDRDTTVLKRYANRTWQRSIKYHKHHRWDGVPSGSWVAREAWDYFSTHMWDDNGGPPRYSVWEAGWLCPWNLRGMGFVEGKEDPDVSEAILGALKVHDPRRYHTPWTHPDAPDITMWCDNHMSSEIVVGGKTTRHKYRVSDVQKGLEALGSTLPAESIRWAKATCYYHSVVESEGDLYRRTRDLERTREIYHQENPDLYFATTSTTTDEVGAVTQVRCDSSYHVTLYKTAEEETKWWFERCPKRGGYPCYGHPYTAPLPLPERMWEDLKTCGWKPPKRRIDHPRGPYFRAFAPEMLSIYGGRIYGPTFRPLVEALLTFMSNLGAANRILGPTSSGWQCGNDRTQREVAQMALKVIRNRVKARRG